MALLDKLSERPSLLVGYPLADIDMTVETRRHLAPPCGHTREGAGGLPIDLRRQEINGAACEPRHGVAVNLVILPVATWAGFHTILVGHGLGTASDTGRTDAKSHPRLGRLDHIVHVLDHLIDVLAPPVALRHRAAACLIGVIQVGIQRERRVVLVVEIIVKDQSVNIIFHQNILADVHHALPHLGDAGVEHGLVTRGQQPLGMGIDIVQFALPPHVAAMAIAVGINPGIHLNATLVGFLDKIAEGVKRRCHPTCARHITGPRLVG